MKFRVAAIFFLSAVLLLVILFLESKQRKNDPTKQVFKSSLILNEARRLAVAGEFQAAVAKYKLAMRPEYIADPYQIALSYGPMIEIYKWTWNFEPALEANEWFLQHSNIGRPTQKALEEKSEIEALRIYQKTGEYGAILEHIHLLRETYNLNFDSENHSQGIEITISDILRLYNSIGMHDEGIRLISDVLNWTFERNKDIARYQGKLNSSNDATKCVEAGQLSDDVGGDWVVCKWIREYLLVREGFERDKAEGFKGCAGVKPGDECVGHAMRALIKSDYFPW